MIDKFRERKRSDLLDGGGNGDGEESDFGVIAFSLPSGSFLRFVLLDSDASILTKARGDNNWTVVRKKTISLPMLRSSIHPLIVALDDVGVEGCELLKVELYNLLISRKRGMGRIELFSHSAHAGK